VSVASLAARKGVWVMSLIQVASLPRSGGAGRKEAKRMSMNRISLVALCCALSVLAGCRQSEAPSATAPVDKAAEPAASGSSVSGEARIDHEPFGKLPDGTAVARYTLTNALGMQVSAIDYGGIITSIKVPDRDGKLADIVLGYDSLEGYVENPPHFGAIIGRYANRIGKASFTLDGKTYPLIANNKGNTLHGGPIGFDKMMWTVEDTGKDEKGVSLLLKRTSPDGEQGFPGNLTAQVRYTLSNANELAIEYSATTDQPTVVNLTHHDYFNLAGEGSGDVLGHRVQIHAERYTPADETLLPTGKLASVAGTPVDFRELTPIGPRINADDALVKLPGGYDHNFVIDRKSDELVLAARVEEPNSGRVMEVRTTEPGMQLYTANHVTGIKGKAGHVYDKHSALCLETQHYPDSPNRPEFPPTTLRPGATYSTKTVYSFSQNAQRAQ